MYVTVLAVILLLTAAIYYWFRTQAMEDINTVQLETLKNINSVFTSHIENYSLTAHEIYSSSSGAVLLTRPRAQTKFIVDFSNYIQAIVANNSAINFVALFDSEDFIFTRQLPAISDQSRALLHKSLVSSSDTLLLFRGEHMVYRYQVPMLCFVIGERGSDGIWKNGAVIGVNAQVLSQNILGDLESTSVIDAAGNVILSADTGLFGEKLQNYDSLADSLTETMAESTTTKPIGGQESLLCSISDGKYRVVSIHPLSRLFASLNDSLLQLLLIIAAVLAASFGITLLIAKQISKPVNALVSEITSISPAPPDQAEPGEDMGSAHIALKQTVNTMAELERSHLQDQQLHYLLGLEGKKSKEPLFPADEDCILFLLQIDADERIPDLTLAPVERAIAGYIAHAIILPMRRDRLAVVAEDRGNEVEQALPQLQQDLMKLIGAPVSISVSDREEPGNLSRRYGIASQRMNVRALRGPATPITRRQEHAMNQDKLPPALAEQIYEAVKLFDEEKLNLAVQALLEEAAAYHYKAVLRQISQICITAFNTASTAQSSEEFLSEVYHSLLNCPTQEQLKSTITSYLQAAATQLSAIQGIQQKNIMESALAYLQEHFTDGNISMKAVAAEMHMSASHFSHNFKELTGETFPAYINRLRLEKSHALLLADKDSTIEKIAQEVGFYSASYFTSAFKKQYGISPSQVRRYDTVQAQAGGTEQTLLHEDDEA